MGGRIGMDLLGSRVAGEKGIGVTLIDGATIVEVFRSEGVTHLVWIPDSAMGTWDEAVSRAEGLVMVRPAREGEAIAIAGGLWLGGCSPVVAIQCTGFFEAGDSLRNVLHDLAVPLFCIVGCRSYFATRQGGTDTAAQFAEPLLRAWDLPYTLIDRPMDSAALAAIYRTSRRDRKPHALLLAE